MTSYCRAMIRSVALLPAIIVQCVVKSFSANRELSNDVRARNQSFLTTLVTRNGSKTFMLLITWPLCRPEKGCIALINFFS